MSTTVAKISAIQDEMAKTQKNKATSYHLGQLKAKLAKLRRELIDPKSSGGSGPGLGFDVAKTGVASVGFVGFPSVGKSTLMSKLTGTESEVAAYEFTTLTTVPGSLKMNGAAIQILDLPGIIEGAKDGKGRGRQVIAVARTCNLIFIVLDVTKPLGHMKVLMNELEGVGIRLNKTRPNITIKQRERGGLSVTHTVPLTNVDQDEIRAVCSEYRMNSATISIHEPDCTIEQIIDVLEGNRVYMPCIFVLNKIDATVLEELELLYKIPNSVPISSKLWLGIDDLLEEMWKKLALVRVYTKPKGKQPDYTEPVVLRTGKSNVGNFADAIHSTIREDFKHAQVWGTSVRHPGQKVGLDHVLEDEDVVTFFRR